MMKKNALWCTLSEEVIREVRKDIQKRVERHFRREKENDRT